jgi:hypothetical protein
MIKKALVLTFCLSLLTGAVLFAKDKRQNLLVAKQSVILNDTCYTTEIIPGYPSYYRQAKEPVVYFLSSDDTIGFTYYDYQYNATQRRQIANDLAGNLHFTWMDLIGPDMTYNRYMDYNARYASGNWLTSGGMHVTPAEGRAGYGGLDILPDNREVLCYHQLQPTIPSGDFWGSVVSIEDSLPGTGQFSHFDIPDSMPWSLENFKSAWPAVACSKVNNGDTAFIQIAVEDNRTSCTMNKNLGYIRCFESLTSKDTLVCQSPGWGSPVLIPKNIKLAQNKIRFPLSTALRSWEPAQSLPHQFLKKSA